MKDDGGASTVAPPQHLLSTIYRQSWHPVASTQRHTQRKPAVTRNGPVPIAPPFQPTVSPRKRSSSLTDNYKTYVCRTASLGLRHHKATPRQQSLATPNHPEQKRVQNSANNAPEGESISDLCAESKASLENLKLHNSSGLPLGTKQVQTPLSVWRRRLKTYVANSRSTSRCEETFTGTSLAASAPSIPLHFAGRQHSWSTLSNTKGYRIVNYPNNTLAKICLEGKSPPMQPRPESHQCLERTRSFDSAYQETDVLEHGFDDKYEDSGRERNPSYECLQPSQDSESAESEDGKVLTDRAANSEESTPQDASMHDSNSNDAHSNTEDEDEYIYVATCDQRPECTDVWRCNGDGAEANRGLSEDLDVSDLSENECFSDREDDGSDLEQTENDMERFKKLYENENRSALSESATTMEVCPTTSAAHESKHAISVEQELPDISDCEACESVPDYAFADVLPSEFSGFNLGELASLPPDINWRSVVDISHSSTNVKLRFQNRQQHQQACNAGQRHRRRSRMAENQAAIETVVDRILAMEKLQSLTVQQEVQRRYHNAHHRHSFVRSKSVSGKTTPATPAPEATPPATEPSGDPPVSRSTSRRRNSNPNVSMRMAWATETTQGDASVFKRACKDGDLTILHKHWLASCRNNSRRSGATSRRNSENANNVDNHRHRPFRSRPGTSMYTYEWSERCKDDKNRYTPFLLSHSRPCPACRERARKLRRASTSCGQSLGRPRTPRPTSRANSRQATSDKSNLLESRSPASLTNKTATLSTSIVSPLLWKQCKPAGSNLQVAKTTIKSVGRDYEYLTKSFNRGARGKPAQVSSDAQLLSSAVTISSALFNGGVN